MRRPRIIRTLATLPLCAALLVAGISLLGAARPASATGVAGAAALELAAHLLLATRDGKAAARRQLRLRQIDRVARSGRRDGAGRLMPMLKDPDRVVREHAEQAIWSLWGRSGDPAIDRMFRAGVGQIGRREIHHAIDTLTMVVDNSPSFAEAWNKRATARFIAGDLAGAMDDCERVLALVPDHFGALEGYGHIYFRMDDLDMAILYWRRALAVNPHLDSVERSIEAAQKMLVGRGRLST